MEYKKFIVLLKFSSFITNNERMASVAGGEKRVERKNRARQKKKRKKPLIKV